MLDIILGVPTIRIVMYSLCIGAPQFMETTIQGVSGCIGICRATYRKYVEIQVTSANKVFSAWRHSSV